MALRVQGLATVERAATATGLPHRTVVERLGKLAADEYVKERSGRLCGYALTPSGITVLDELLSEEGLRTSDALHECYDAFMVLNQRVLKICSDWQVRRHAGVEEPNDHADPAYDHGVIERLEQLHGRASKCIASMSGCAARYTPYGPRFDACIDRLVAGDHAAFTAPIAESYHTVWFELHQDLLLTLDLKREG
jgi:hypothetical protein